MTIPSKVYDILKWCAQILLPGCGTLYFTLCTIWGFPYGEQVIGTLSALAIFLGVLLGISSSKYEGQGTLHIDTSGDSEDIYRLALTEGLSDIAKRGSMTLKVNANARLTPIGEKIP